jgi:hypothetical protein
MLDEADGLCGPLGRRATQGGVRATVREDAVGVVRGITRGASPVRRLGGGPVGELVGDVATH